MAGIVLYRRWRPQRFADIVGQDPIVRTLQNAVAQDKAAHAYLFSGPRGTGKTSAGRILAKALNCVAPRDGDACGACESCRAIEEGRALDLVEVDAASNRGIENIRDLRERANYVPGAAKVKVYLIDEVHQLTGAAADALLKTLEEPPPYVHFILATTEPESLKPTVLSRCQRFDFRRIGLTEIHARLRQIADAETITIPDEALDLIGREATGSLRDAVNLLDQVWAYYGSAIALEDTAAGLGLSVDGRALDLARAVLHKDLKQGLAILAAVQGDAVEMHRFNRQLLSHLRRALLWQSGAVQALALSEPEQQTLTDLVQGVDPVLPVVALKAFSGADVRSDPYLALPLELALAQVVLEPAASPPPVERKSPSPRSQRPRAKPTQSPPRRRQPATAAPSSVSTPPAKVGASTAASQSPAVGRRTLTPEEEQLRAIRQRLNAQGHRHLGAALNGSCKIVSLDDATLTLGFYPLYLKFHKGRVEESSDLVAAAAGDVIGRSIAIQCQALADTEDEEPRARSALVAEAERLGARIVGERRT